jgi:hypothetical protein
MVGTGKTEEGTMKRRSSPAAADEPLSLWPFGVLIALAAVPLLWLFLAAILWMTNRWLNWPTAKSAGGLLYLAVVVGLVPIILLVLDSIARSGGSVTTPWGSLNFRSGATADTRPSVEIETGLGSEGQPINDSMVVSVHQTLDAARANDIVRIDLGTGENWWMTRLFALSFGATRAGAPKLCVFVGRDASTDHSYFGWMQPRDALRIMRRERAHLRFALDRAESIARYMTTVAPTVPAAPLTAVPPPGDPQLQPLMQPAATYATHPFFQGLGEETALRVLLDLLGKYEALPGPGQPVGGERVTAGVLLNTFGPELQREKIDITWSDQRQLEAFFDTTDEYIAIVERDRFVRIVPRSQLENDLLRQLVTPTELADRS